MASGQQWSFKAGFYPLNVDNVNNDPPGCGLGCSQLHALGYCPAFKKMKVKGRWDVVIQSKRCKKCLKTGHRHQQCSQKACDINSCKRPHHHLLHKESKPDDKKNLDPNATPLKPPGRESNQVGSVSASSAGTACVPIQKVKVHSTDGHAIEGLAMVDSGSNQSLI